MLIGALFAGACVLFCLCKDLWWTRNVFYVFLSVALILALSQIYRLFDRFAPVINKPFAFLGTISLEIYLSHEKVQENFLLILRACGAKVEFGDVWYQCVCIALAILIAFGVNRLIAVIVRATRNRKQKKNADATQQT